MFKNSHKTLLLISIVTTLLILFAGLPVRPNGLPAFPKDIKQIEATSVLTTNQALEISIPEGYPKVQGFYKDINIGIIPKTCGNQLIKIGDQNNTQDQKKSAFCSINAGGDVFFGTELTPKNKLLARLNPQYFNNPALIKDLARSYKKILKIKEGKTLLVDTTLLKTLALEKISIVFYRKSGAKLYGEAYPVVKELNLTDQPNLKNAKEANVAKTAAPSLTVKSVELLTANSDPESMTTSTTTTAESSTIMNSEKGRNNTPGNCTYNPNPSRFIWAEDIKNFGDHDLTIDKTKCKEVIRERKGTTLLCEPKDKKSNLYKTYEGCLESLELQCGIIYKENIIHNEDVDKRIIYNDLGKCQDDSCPSGRGICRNSNNLQKEYMKDYYKVMIVHGRTTYAENAESNFTDCSAYRCDYKTLEADDYHGVKKISVAWSCSGCEEASSPSPNSSSPAPSSSGPNSSGPSSSGQSNSAADSEGSSSATPGSSMESSHSATSAGS